MAAKKFHHPNDSIDLAKCLEAAFPDAVVSTAKNDRETDWGEWSISPKPCLTIRIYFSINTDDDGKRVKIRITSYAVDAHTCELTVKTIYWGLLPKYPGENGKFNLEFFRNILKNIDNFIH